MRRPSRSPVLPTTGAHRLATEAGGRRFLFVPPDDLPAAGAKRMDLPLPERLEVLTTRVRPARRHRDIERRLRPGVGADPSKPASPFAIAITMLAAYGP